MTIQRLLDRFLRYVQIDTTAVDDMEQYPSSPGQWELGKLLVAELDQMGLAATQDENAVVHAMIPATVADDVETIAFNAHLDTSPETTGRDVQPQVVSNYSGGDLVLPGNPELVLRVAENPELAQLHGHTLITTDGTTLLGADDKAGVAIIMEAANRLMEQPELRHGPVRLLFTCDEEIGRGVDHVDVAGLQAAACYTLDGPGAGSIDVETFSADMALVTIKGVNIHPSIAKDRMVNAVRAAGHFLSLLPGDQSPERTSGGDGFLHPYVIEGGVSEVIIKVLLRSFQTPQLDDYRQQLESAARETMTSISGCRVEVEIRTQYRNLGEGLASEPRAVGLAQNAYRQLGCEAKLSQVRGGTDGSLLTAKGLPTPNLSSGQHNPHSPLEWACLEEMEEATNVVIELAREWAENGQSRDAG